MKFSVGDRISRITKHGQATHTFINWDKTIIEVVGKYYKTKNVRTGNVARFASTYLEEHYVLSEIYKKTKKFSNDLKEILK